MIDPIRSKLRDDADDLVYRMRNIAGTGDIDAAARCAKDALNLINEAFAYDRGLAADHEDSGVTLGYCFEMAHLVLDNLRGVPEGNRSRAARSAARRRA